MVEGRLHSLETMGLVDGPGIRTVFFLQGCPLRCAYCHNPDSQSMFSKETITPEQVLETASKYKAYYKSSGGGITFSGGEPLLQGEFLAESLKMLKENGFHTTIDTCGFGDERYYRQVLKNTDVIMLDLKHFSEKGYKDITGKSMKRFYSFLSYLNDFKGKIWIRHVMVPTITDNMESIYELFGTVSHLAEKIEKFEILPYHRMGVHKYEDLNMEYKLEGIPEMDKEKAREYEEVVSELLAKQKQKLHKRIV